MSVNPGFTTSTSSGTSGVYIDSTAGTLGVRVGQVDGTVAVYFSPANPAVAATFSGSIAAVPQSGSGDPLYDEGKNAMVVMQKAGETFAVYFDPSNPAVAATFSSASLEVIPTTGSRIMYDLNHQAVRALIVGTSAAASLQVTGITNSIAVHLLSTGGTLGVNIGTIAGTTAVYLHSTGGTLGVNVGKISDTVAVYLHSTAGSIGVNVGKISDTVAVYLIATAGTLRIKLDPSSPGIGTDDVAFPTGGSGTPVMGLFDDTSTDSVDEGDIGVIRMTGNRLLMGHLDSTASLFTASGTASGVSVSGNTIISPSANAAFKIYAYSIQTTGQVSIATKFTNGAGTGPTEYWRPLVTASGVTGVQGANLTSWPSAPLFAVGVSTTLSLVLDSATLVHYSVAYTKESA